MTAERVLVSGGAGFIGSHLVDGLLEAGHEVRVLDDFSSGRRENLAHCLDRIDLIEGDVRDTAAVQAAVAGCANVAHLAAVASVSASFAQPAEVNCSNVGGTVKVLEAARAARVRRVVFASSCAVYGDAQRLPVDEQATPQPLSPYAVGKLAGEGYCRALADGSFDTLALRFFNVFGPRQDPSSEYSGVIARFCEAAAAGAGGVVYGDGEQTRDFVYVTDVVAALLAALAVNGPLGGVAVNVGSGDETSVLDVAGAVAAASGAPLAIRHEAARAGDIRRSRADVGRAAVMLDWRPQYSFAEGLELTWRWYARRG